jgi:hypothetical protein
LDLAGGADAFSVTARTSCAFRFAGVNLASCSFRCGRTADARLAAAAVFVAFTLFAAAAFRAAALAAFFAAVTRATALTLVVIRFRFESFVATVFALARVVFVVLRAPRVFDAVLLFVTRIRALDDEAPFVVRLDFGFALAAAPVFFVFDFVVFLDLLGATIINLSTRKLSAHVTDPARTLLWIRARILLFWTAS